VADVPAVRDPAKPVKLRLRKTAPVVIVSVYVPALILNDMLLASENEPVVMVEAVAVELLKLTTGVPEMVKLVTSVESHPAPAPVQVMLPVPKLMVLAVVPLAPKFKQESVYDPRFSVPAAMLADVATETGARSVTDPEGAVFEIARLPPNESVPDSVIVP
jgi:hypothetical protein